MTRYFVIMAVAALGLFLASSAAAECEGDHASQLTPAAGQATPAAQATVAIKEGPGATGTPAVVVNGGNVSVQASSGHVVSATGAAGVPGAAGAAGDAGAPGTPTR